jgi:hypothetical protein
VGLGVPYEERVERALIQRSDAKQVSRVRRSLTHPGVNAEGPARGLSNAKAKRELAWRPAHASWHGGLTAA